MQIPVSSFSAAFVKSVGFDPHGDLSIFGTTCTVLNDALVLKRVVCIIYVCVYIYVPFLSIVVQVQPQIMILLEVNF